MQTNRRRFLSLLGVGAASAPLAAKAAADAQFSGLVGLGKHGALSSAGMGLSSGSPGVGGEAIGEAIKAGMPYTPYHERLIKAADYIKAFGVPEHLEATFRDHAKWIGSLDPDIACKQSWSMSVKLMTQRERNYQRQVERVKVSGWQERKKQVLEKLLGFEWPL